MAIKQDGSKVELHFDSEADAREMKARLAAGAMDDAGKLGGLKRAYRTADELIGMQPAMEFVGWALLCLGCVMEFLSWSNLLPGKGLPFVFGSIGVFIFLGTKFSAAKWARAVNARQPKRIDAYRFWTFIGLAICALMASQLMASQMVNEDQGARTIRAEIETLEDQARDLRRSILTAERDGVTSKTVEYLEFELSAVLGQPAKNSNGNRTGKTVGDEVGDCIGSSFYKDTYCDQINGLKRDIFQRKPYEAIRAELAEKEKLILKKRDEMPKASGVVALGQKWSDGGGFWQQILPGMLLMFIVAGAMVGATFLSKWDPPDDWEAEA